MRKIATLLIAVLTLVSCGDEVEFSTPALQGNKNYELWRAEFFNAALDVDGQLTITGGNNIEDISFVLPSANVGTYLLSDTSAGRADFVDFNGVAYSTANTPDPSVTLYPEIGEVEITESTAGYVTGTFRFIAFTADGLQSVGFNEGIFYRVPFAGGNGSGNNGNCQDATLALATAAGDFSEVTQGDPEYVARCNAYKEALQDVIDACGDEGGTLQAIFDNLTCEDSGNGSRFINATIDGAPFNSEEDDVYGGSMSYSPSYDVDGVTCIDIAYGASLYPAFDESQPHMSVSFYRFLTEAGITCTDETENFDTLFPVNTYDYSFSDTDYGVGVSYYTGDVTNINYVSLGGQDASASFEITSVTPFDCVNPLFECIVVEGTFSCRLYNQIDATDFIDVTNGTFKLAMTSYNN